MSVRAGARKQSDGQLSTRRSDDTDGSCGDTCPRALTQGMKKCGNVSAFPTAVIKLAVRGKNEQGGKRSRLRAAQHAPQTRHDVRRFAQTRRASRDFATRRRRHRCRHRHGLLAKWSMCEAIGLGGASPEVEVDADLSNETSTQKKCIKLAPLAQS